MAATSAPVANPDEIEISLEDAEDETNAPADEKAVDTKPTPEPAPPALINPDEIILDDEVDDVQVHATVPGVLAPQVASATSFLALDKCLPQRQYLEILDIPSEPNSSENNEPSFMFDLEWLAITRAAHPFLTSARLQGRLPALKATKEMVATELEWVTANVGEKNVEIVQTFTMTAPGPEPQAKGKCTPTLPPLVGSADMNVPTHSCAACDRCSIQQSPDRSVLCNASIAE